MTGPTIQPYLGGVAVLCLLLFAVGDHQDIHAQQYSYYSQKVNTRVPLLSSVAVKDSVVVCAGYDSVIYYAATANMEWHEGSIGLDIGSYIYDVALGPDNIAIAGVYNGIVISRDNGVSWNEVGPLDLTHSMSNNTNGDVLMISENSGVRVWYSGTPVWERVSVPNHGEPICGDIANDREYAVGYINSGTVCVTDVITSETTCSSLPGVVLSLRYSPVNQLMAITYRSTDSSYAVYLKSKQDSAWIEWYRSSWEIRSIACTPTNHCILVGDNDSVYASRTVGDELTAVLSIPMRGEFADVVALNDSSVCYVTGDMSHVIVVHRQATHVESGDDEVIRTVSTTIVENGVELSIPTHMSRIVSLEVYDVDGCRALANVSYRVLPGILSESETVIHVSGVSPGVHPILVKSVDSQFGALVMVP